MGKYLNQPIFHFIVIAAIIFGWNQFVNKEEKEELLVSKQAQNFLINQNEQLIGRALTKDEKKKIIQSFIQDELLLEMAYERGLGKV